MRPVVVTVDSLGASDWLPVDYKQVPFNVGMGAVLSAGAALTYTVEHTFDNIQDSAIVPTAFPNSGLNSQTANGCGNYAAPVRAVRLNVTSHTSGDVTLTILQGGQ